MKLFTIGDSISQGFMSGAAARTDLSYSTLIAKHLGINDYLFPSWEKGGHPVNIEEVFRRLQKRLGTNIAGLIEWPIALNLINNYLDDVEDYYERGAGRLPVSVRPYHNISIRGFDLSSSWQITPDLCESYINASPGNKDNWFGLVDESFLRTAFTVLSAGRNADQNYSQLDWLNFHHQNEGVENLIVWLGANNALGTVLGLTIRQTSNDGNAFPEGPEKVSYDTRRQNDWNLWHPDDFRAEYKFMLDRIVKIMENNPQHIDYKVFIGTIPLVTIAPIIKAVGEINDRVSQEVIEWPVDTKNPAPVNIGELSEPQTLFPSYGKYYPYFPFADNFKVTDPHLNMQEVLHIDNCIRKYNRIIQELVVEANISMNARRFYLVDLGTVLNKMALKRNNLQPPYQFPGYFEYIYPKIDTRYYGTTRNGKIKAGGLFSLDGVHPTAVGQGLIAYEFLKVMKQAGSFTGDPEKDMNWKQIFNSDSLYSQPVGLLGEIYENANVARWILNAIHKIKPLVRENK
jgi:hypothetical protein